MIVLVSRRRADKFAVRARELRAVDYQSSLGFGAVLNPRSGTFGAMPSSAGFGQPSKFGAASPPITNGMRGVYSIPPPTPHIGLHFRLLLLPSILFLLPPSNPRHQQSQAKSLPSETFAVISDRDTFPIVLLNSDDSQYV